MSAADGVDGASLLALQIRSVEEQLGLGGLLDSNGARRIVAPPPPPPAVSVA